MQKKNGIEHTKLLCLAGALVTACFLCGCTRKEELLFLTEESAPEEAVSEVSGETERAAGGDTALFLQEGAAASESTGISAEDRSEQETPVKSSLLCVHVCGAVETPGVYELPAGSRVYEAVQAAGGFTADAEQNYVNQAQMLTDGVKLVIPTREEAAAADSEEKASDMAARKKSGAVLQIGIVGGEEQAEAEAETAGRTDAKININTASVKELCSIPGVGETRAAAIVSYRESHGAFSKPEDIMKVSGIKEGMYEKIKDSISVY